MSDPFNPRKTGSVHLGGMARHAAHPKKPNQPLNGDPQMVEISRCSRRIYFTNSLCSTVEEQFYPDGVESWMVKVDASRKEEWNWTETSSWSSTGIAATRSG